MRRKSVVFWSLSVASLVALTALGLPAKAAAEEAEEPPGLAETNPQNPPFVRRWKKDRLEDWYDRREDIRDRREDVRDRREDFWDRREDIRDRRDDRIKAKTLRQLQKKRHEAIQSGDTEQAEILGKRIRRLRHNMARDRKEDFYDRREDLRDRRENFRDRREDFFDRREDFRDRRVGPPGFRHRPRQPQGPRPRLGHRFQEPYRPGPGPRWNRPGPRDWQQRRPGFNRPGPRYRPYSARRGPFARHRRR